MTAAYPARWEADALLSNGRPVHLRPITPDDGGALRRFHDSLSGQTVYFRFFGAKPHLTDADVARFTHVDHHDRVAFIALDGDGIVGVGRYESLGGGSAEVAFVIRDASQGLGIGSVLLEHLAAAARECGITKFVAEVLPENSRMLATFGAAGFEVQQQFDSDVIKVSFDIEPTAASQAVMRSREHRAEARSVERLLHPRRVAVVGASRKPGGLGHSLLLHLVGAGFTGDLVAVHPEVDEIAGVRCVRSLADIDQRVDVCVVVVPAESVADVIRDAAAAKVVSLIVVSDVEDQRALVTLVHGAGMRLVGPNALGVINTDPDVRLNASLVPQLPRQDNVGFFCQSGALGASIVDRMSRAGLGISTFVSAGNRGDISGNDLLQYWEDDAATTVVMLYLETIGNARKFARIVHRIGARKPVVMVRSGGAGAHHPLGHDVGSTMLDQPAVDRILTDCGVILVDTIDQMIDVARIAALQPLPQSSSVAIVGNSDALSVMAVNACNRNGLDVAGESRVFERQVAASSFADAIRETGADPSVGAVIAIHIPPIEDPSDTEVVASIAAAVDGDGIGGKPVVLVTPRAPVEPTLAFFDDVENAVRALAALHRHARWRMLPEQAAEPEPIERAEQPLPPGRYADDAAIDLLRDAGVFVTTTTAGRSRVRIRLSDDLVFGPVLMTGLDEPVAEALGDRSFRLAPVSRVAAETMLAELGTSALLSADERVGAAQVIAHVSALAIQHPEIAEVDLRPGSTSLSVNPTPTELEPPARRM